MAGPDAHAVRLARLIEPGRTGRSLDRLTQAAIACVCWDAEAALGGAWESGSAPPCFFYVKM